MKKTRKTVAALLVAAVMMSFFAPVVFGELTESEKKEKYYEDICSFAKEDGRFESNACLMQAAGLFLGPIGMLLGYFVLPPVPESRIVGRPSDYVEQYTKCFNDRVREANIGYSMWYCIVSTLVITGAILGVGFFGFGSTSGL